MARTPNDRSPKNTAPTKTVQDAKTLPGHNQRPATAVVHAGRDPAASHGFVNTPVYRGSTVLYPTVDALLNRGQRYSYGRRGSPTFDALEDAIASIEGGAGTILTSSGYQAVTTALLAFVEAGDHILVADTVYQPTRKTCDVMLTRFGVRTTYYDPLIGAGIAELFEPRTRLVLTESPGSLTFEVQDIPAIAAAARDRGIWVLMDNTWASPLLFKPFMHGVDVSIQAATKYIVGHADALLGAVTYNDRARTHVERAKDVLGLCAGTEETFLALRGLRTLDVRLERHGRSGVALATWLAGRDEVARVLHPALPFDPGHALWSRDFLGASGLFSVLLKPVPMAAVAAMLDHLELFGMGWSWGGYESLIVPVDPGASRSARPWTGGGPMLRVHVGLDDPDDLRADLERGFARLRFAAENRA